MRRPLRNPRNSANVFANALDNTKSHSRTSRPHQTLIYEAGRSQPALKVGGMDGRRTVWWYAARTEPAWMPPATQIPCGPDGPHMR